MDEDIRKLLERVAKDAGIEGPWGTGPDGKRLSFVEFVLLCSPDSNDRHIGFDNIDGTEVSTVWMPGVLDRPATFETMVFGGRLDRRQFRWPNREAAQEGHKKVCALVIEASVR